MLLAFIDDATSRLMHAAFVPSESTLDYLRETNAYITRHGRPIAFYSDKHAIFRVTRRDAAGGDGMTQFGRALHELNIDIICANSAPAKGRVERSFGTLQDRLVKEMRLAGISTLQAGNAFLPSFIEDHNRRFGKVPLARSPLTPATPTALSRLTTGWMTCSPGKRSGPSRAISPCSTTRCSSSSSQMR